MYILPRGPFLTEVADVFSELLERRVQAFRVGADFGGVQHEGHAVDLLHQARPLHVADSLRRIHRLIWTELIKEEERRKLVLGVTVATVPKQQLRTKRQLIHQTAVQAEVSRPYLVSLGYKTFNDRQDVMEGGSRHGSVAQAHGVTQHQSTRLFSAPAVDFEEL